MNASLDFGFQLCIKALKGKQEDRTYNRWLSEKNNLKDDYRWDYNKYKSLFEPKKIMSQSEIENKKKKIDSETKRIQEKFKKGGE